MRSKNISYVSATTFAQDILVQGCVICYLNALNKSAACTISNAGDYYNMQEFADEVKKTYKAIIQSSIQKDQIESTPIKTTKCSENFQ